jgi:hypothetical protein
MSIIDTSDDTSTSVPKLVAKGVTAIGRHYSRKAWKRVTPREAAALAQHGIDLFVVFEAGSSTLSRAQGLADAQVAVAQAKAIGQAEQSAIYFKLEGLPSGCDSNPLPGARAYMEGVAQGLSGKYKVGLYSDGLLCSTLLNEGLCEYSWLSASPRGFPGSRAFYASKRWNLAQDPRVDQNWFGLSVGLNESNGSFGAFRPAPPAPLEALIEGNRIDLAQYSFSGEPSLQWLTEPVDDRRMLLLDDFWFDDGQRRWEAEGKTTTVDGASIPRALWTLVGSPYTGDYRRASIVHDVACVEAGGSATKRRQADRMFYKACRAGGCSPSRAALLYLGVRIGAYAGLVPAWRGAFDRSQARLELTAAEARLAADYRLAGERLLRSGYADGDDTDALEKEVDMALQSILDVSISLFDDLAADEAAPPA